MKYVGIFVYRIAISATPKVTITENGNTVRSKTQERKLARRRRTNFLLMMVSLVFFVAWAPIHIYLLALDIINPYQVKSTMALSPETQIVCDSSISPCMDINCCKLILSVLEYCPLVIMSVSDRNGKI